MLDSSSAHTGARGLPDVVETDSDQTGVGLAGGGVTIAPTTCGLAAHWHPEEQADDIRLFIGLVAAATEYRARQTLPSSGTPTTARTTR